MPLTVKQYRTEKKLQELTASGRPMNRDTMMEAIRHGYGLPADTSKSKLAVYLADFNKSAERQKAERKSPRHQRFIRAILKKAVTSQG